MVAVAKMCSFSVYSFVALCDFNVDRIAHVELAVTSCLIDLRDILHDEAYVSSPPLPQVLFQRLEQFCSNCIHATANAETLWPSHLVRKSS